MAVSVGTTVTTVKVAHQVLFLVQVLLSLVVKAVYLAVTKPTLTQTTVRLAEQVVAKVVVLHETVMVKLVVASWVAVVVAVLVLVLLVRKVQY
jgi:hypothetical protein